MLFVAVAMMLLPHSVAAAPDPLPTFDYEDPFSGHKLRCAFCPPGTRVRAHCTRSLPTECAPCPPGHHTQYWNYLPRCLPCRAPCDFNQRERHECAPTRDRECECAPGHYWRAEQCVRHTRCGPGFGAKRNGTTHRDTECERCPRGTFSVGNSVNGQCIPHTGCNGKLYKVLQATNWHDDVCLSCAQVKNEGAAVLRGILPTFFIHKKLRQGKLKKLVRLLGTRGRQLRSASGEQDLLHCISKWTGSAEDQQLWKLPEMLEKIQLNKTAKNLKKIFEKFQRFVALNCKVN